MDKEQYYQEGVDFKRLFLLFIRRIWIVILATIAGCVIGAVLYNFVTSITNGVPTYCVSSDYYITFNFEEFENSVDYYNAYTWDSILRDDPIVDTALTLLPDDISKEQVKAAVSGEMIGDYRILTVNVNTADPALSQTIAEAYEQSLAAFADKIDMLISIELWSKEEPALVNQNTRTGNAAFLGGLIGALLSLFLLFVVYLLDDSIYVESDFTKRYEIPFLGVVTDKKNEKLLNELVMNYKYICGTDKKYYPINVAVSNTLENPCVPLLVEKCPGIQKQIFLEESSFEEIRQADGAILLVPYGQTNGKITIRIIDQLQKQDCKIVGAIMTDADDRFLKQYYIGRRSR